MRLAFAFCTAFSLALAVPAAAQDTQPDNDQVARRAFEAGRQAFTAGDYESALQRFREAYELSQRGELLYNIAQTLDRLRRDDETLAMLRQYLEAVPNTRSRAEVEARIRVLERTLADRQAELERQRLERARNDEIAEQQAASSEQAGEPEPVVPAARPPLHPAIFVTAATLALAGGGLAVWTGLETLSLHDAYLASDELGEATRLYDEGRAYEMATNVLIFSSAAIGVAAIVMLFFTDWGGGEAETAQAAWVPSFAVQQDAALIGAEGRF